MPREPIEHAGRRRRRCFRQQIVVDLDLNARCPRRLQGLSGVHSRRSHGESTGKESGLPFERNSCLVGTRRGWGWPIPPPINRATAQPCVMHQLLGEGQNWPHEECPEASARSLGSKESYGARAHTLRSACCIEGSLARQALPALATIRISQQSNGTRPHGNLFSLGA
jgi:hypothetical protein